VGPELPRIWSAPLYAGAVVGTVGLLLAARRTAWRKQRRRGVAFGAYSVILASLFLALSASGELLDLRYHGVWSPETVEEATSVLEDHTDPDATVASGGVIWEFQAGRKPFARVTHPLVLRSGAGRSERDRLRRKLLSSPPGAVVTDGYTEQTYFRVLPEMEGLLDREFDHVATITGSRFPVRIHVHNSESGGGRTEGAGE
ncbi:MAG: hypothetical protein ACOC83_10310, partial [Gemmatimonadota bacterium]